ncbi:MAG: ClbS/DfsB family four-helix bundle protein [Pseudomonadota bacterium]
MPSSIPRTRQQLIDTVSRDYAALVDVLVPGIGNQVCVEDWTVKGLLNVRTWWTEAVVSWVRSGQSGETPVMPAPGYRWSETPQLNAKLARRRVSYQGAKQQLDSAYLGVMALIDDLDDDTLTIPGVYPWAGKNGVCGLINLNTARQYRTARSFIKQLLRDRGEAHG